jgi:hypothetical protein
MRLSDRHLLDAVARRVQKRGLGDLLAHDVALEEVREPDFGFVFEVDGCGDGEDLCCVVSIVGKRVILGDLRSNSSRVSCLVSRTKQKIMPHAMRLRPA